MKDLSINEIKETFQALDDLRDIIYSHPKGIVGGPLHIVLDDNNLEDRHLDFCVNEAFKDYSASIVAVSTAIVTLLRTLTIAQRYIWSRSWDYDDPAKAAIEMRDYKLVRDEKLGSDFLVKE